MSTALGLESLERLERLELLELRLRRRSGPLLPQIRAALAGRGQPLRWAITGVEPDPAGAQLRIEAVMIRPPA